MFTGDTTTGTGAGVRDRLEAVTPEVMVRGVDALKGDGDLSKRLRDEVWTKHLRLVSMWSTPADPMPTGGAAASGPDATMSGGGCGGGGVTDRMQLPRPGRACKLKLVAPDRGEGTEGGKPASEKLRGGVRACAGAPSRDRGVRAEDSCLEWSAACACGGAT